MLAILTTHPIQYQVPLWQMMARDGHVPFEVWYLTRHGTQPSLDREFGREFSWDLNMLEGYPHQFLRTSVGATPNTPLRCRISQSLFQLFCETNTKAILVMGWQVAAYWQAVWAAHKAGVELWLRGESNILKECETTRRQDNETTGHPPSLKATARRGLKRIALNALFKRVDHFLCIGTANRELYRSYRVPEEKLHMAMYAVDNERFARQAAALRPSRSALRTEWSIPEDAFCVLFCGKFIPKKRPMDMIEAAKLMLSPSSKLQAPSSKIHLLFAGSGELGAELRANCNVVYDAENSNNQQPLTINSKPPASFVGFLNQTQVSRAYVAADVLVLPSDYDETWGLVVNEAMASGLRCIISDHCGCAPDLGRLSPNETFRYADHADLARKIENLSSGMAISCPPSLGEASSVIEELYTRLSANSR